MTGASCHQKFRRHACVNDDDIVVVAVRQRAHTRGQDGVGRYTIWTTTTILPAAVAAAADQVCVKGNVHRPRNEQDRMRRRSAEVSWWWSVGRSHTRSSQRTCPSAAYRPRQGLITRWNIIASKNKPLAYKNPCETTTLPHPLSTGTDTAPPTRPVRHGVRQENLFIKPSRENNNTMCEIVLFRW